MIVRLSLCKFESYPALRQTVGIQFMLVKWMLTAQMNADCIHTVQPFGAQYLFPFLN